MPGYDGTGPLGQGPMTGQAKGYCVLKKSDEKPYQVEGLAGINGVPVKKDVNAVLRNKTKMNNKPVYTKPIVSRFGFYRIGFPLISPRRHIYGYRKPYSPWFMHKLRFGRVRGFRLRQNLYRLMFNRLRGIHYAKNW